MKVTRVHREARDRELVALVGGPWTNRWFWLDDLLEMQANTGHVSPALVAYRPVSPARRVHNPDPTLADLSGQVWECTDPSASLALPRGGVGGG